MLFCQVLHSSPLPVLAILRQPSGERSPSFLRKETTVVTGEGERHESINNAAVNLQRAGGRKLTRSQRRAQKLQRRPLLSLLKTGTDYVPSLQRFRNTELACLVPELVVFMHTCFIYFFFWTQSRLCYRLVPYYLCYVRCQYVLVPFFA